VFKNTDGPYALDNLLVDSACMLLMCLRYAGLRLLPDICIRGDESMTRHQRGKLAPRLVMYARNSYEVP
jgi:hypothetical protein